MTRRLTDGQQAAGREVRTKRGELKFTQEDLADQAGVSRRAIQDFESGKRWPRPDNLGHLERALGWHRGYLSDLAARHDSTAEPVGAADADEQLIDKLPHLLEEDRALFRQVYRARREDAAAKRLADLERMRAGAADIADEEVRRQITGEFDRQIAELKRRGYEALTTDAQP